MRLTKRQALVLLRCADSLGEAPTNVAQDDMDDVALALEAFLTDEDAAESDPDDDDHLDEAEAQEDDLDQGEEGDEPEADLSVAASALHALPACKPGSSTLEFENTSAEGLVVLLDGDLDASGITHLTRFADTLQVLDADGDWTGYKDIKRFPKGWAQALPLGKTAKVTA
jgi:hypothetical protein